MNILYNITFQLYCLQAFTHKKYMYLRDAAGIQLKGDIVKDIHFNAKPRRNAPSVHLMYPLPDSVKAVSFYNEVTIPAGVDIPNSYFMACGLPGVFWYTG